MAKGANLSPEEAAKFVNGLVIKSTFGLNIPKAKRDDLIGKIKIRFA